jgi:hypothetical protein
MMVMNGTAPGRAVRRPERDNRSHMGPVVPLTAAQIDIVADAAMHSRCWRWVKGGHAEQVAAAAGSPQKAALLAAAVISGMGHKETFSGCWTTEPSKAPACSVPRGQGILWWCHC